GASSSLDHLVSARKECGRYGQTERLGGSEIDDQFKYGWLLNRQVGRLGAFQDFVNVHGSLAIQVGKSRGVRHQPTFLGEPSRHRNRRHTILQRQLGGAFARQAGLNDNGIGPLLLDRGESALELLSAADPAIVDRSSAGFAGKLDMFEERFGKGIGRKSRPATASVTAPATTRLRETWVENSASLRTKGATHELRMHGSARKSERFRFP